MSVISTTPSLPKNDSKINSLTVELSRELSSSEKTNFTAILSYKTMQNEISNLYYELSDGKVKSGSSNVGTYTFTEDDTVSVSWTTTVYVQSFTLGS